ncbi:DNA repair protein RecO [Corynebacterium sp. 335C]
MARPYRERALVVRRHDLGEADRIVVLFTRGRGIVRAVAKGVRRAKSRFGSRLAPFVDVDVQLYPGRTLESITGADTVRTWAAPLVDDYARYTAACAVLEVAERVAGEEGVPNPELWDATADALEALADPDDPLGPDLTVTRHVLVAMASAGIAPALFDCAGCGKPGPHHAFSPALGGAACVECRPPGAATPPTEALHLMWLLQHGHVDAVVRGRETLPRFGALSAQARDLAAAHLRHQLGRGVRALDLVDARWGTMDG